MAEKAIARAMQMAYFFSALLALYLCPTVIAGELEPYVPGCYRSCMRNTTDVRDDCDVRDLECVCTHDWITKAVICCFVRECPEKEWLILDDIVYARCQGKVTNIPLGSSIYCYEAWSKEVATAVITIPPYTGTTASTGTNAATSTAFMGSTITDIATPFTKLNGLSPSIAPFNGVSMFTGSCTSPRIAFASASAGSDTTAYPWMGCSQENHGCCAFSGDELKALTVCPYDYTTTNSACCPSKWEIYTTILGGQTPCYTSLKAGFAGLPTLTDNATFITDLAFTMKYSLITKESSALSSGAMAGVIIGSVIGGMCLLGIIGHLILLRRRNQRSRAAVPDRGSGDSSLYPDVQAPLELPGSTFIHENHPAFNPSRLQHWPRGES